MTHHCVYLWDLVDHKRLWIKVPGIWKKNLEKEIRTHAKAGIGKVQKEEQLLLGDQKRIQKIKYDAKKSKKLSWGVPPCTPI